MARAASFPYTPETAELIRKADASGQSHYIAGWSGVWTESAAPSIAVAVTCHRAYLPYLRRQVEAIEAQTRRADERVVCLDGCAPPPWLRERGRNGWTILSGNYGTPNPMRNLAIDATKSEWLVFADADDAMAPGYLAGVDKSARLASSRVGIIAADLHWSSGRTMAVPETLDYWRLRRENYISACSAWRRGALIEAGYWPATGCYDDHALALAVTAAGWQQTRNAEPILITCHAGDHRSARAVTHGADLAHKTQCRTYAIVTLLAGKTRCLERWAEWLRTAELPDKCALYIVNNAPDKEAFSRRAWELAMAPAVRSRFALGVHWRDDSRACCGVGHWAKHEHVPVIYNAVIPNVREDMLVTLEDDVVPPRAGLTRLIDAWNIRALDAGVAAVVPSRMPGASVTAADARDWWHDIPKIEDLPADGLREVGFVGGGLTLWNQGFVQACLPFRFWYWQGHASGWDSSLCRDVRAMGGRLMLHCGVRCEHDMEATR